MNVVVSFAGDTMPGLASELRRRGIVARYRPLIYFVPPTSWDPLDAELRLIGPDDAMALTSPRAARVLVQRYPRTGSSLAELRQVWVVGSGTMAALTGTIPAVRLPASDRPATGTSLADAILAAGVESVLFLCGDRRLDALPSRLGAGGVRVVEVVVYRTVVAPAPEVSEAVRGATVLVGSPSVAAAIAASPAAATVRIVALGTTTAAAARDGGLKVVAVAAEPTVSGVVDAVAESVA